MVVAIAGCTRSSVKAAPTPTQDTIGGTSVPWPPEEYGFDHANRDDLIVSSRFDYFLYFSSLPPDPEQLASRARDLDDFYVTAMSKAGWMLFHRAPIRPSDDPDVPEQVVEGGHEWHRHGRAIAIHIGTYELLGKVGWKLKLMVVDLGDLESETRPTPR
jgi:hypothetical protein